MEALTQLMSLIDLNSKSLSEGDYLEMCKHMKHIYKVLQRPSLEGDVFQYALEIGRATRQIKQLESRLKYLKIKKRVTAAVRKDAVRERAQQLGIRLRDYTLEELRAKGHSVSDERSFYRSYLDRSNLVTQGVILDIQDEIVEISARREAQKVRHRSAYESFYGRPPQ